METLEGIAAEPFFALTMTVGKVTHDARSAAPPAMVLGDDTRVELDLTGATLAPNVDEEDDFESLLARGLGRPFLDRAPGAHVKVRIRGLHVEAGTPLCVSGTVARARAAAEGYRDAGELVPTSISVDRIAAGADARSAIDEAPLSAPRTKDAERVEAPRLGPPSLRASWGLALLGLGALAAAGARGALGALLSSPADANGWDVGASAAGAFFLSIAVFAAARARFLPDLRAWDEDRDGTGRRVRIGWIYGTCLAIPGALVVTAGGAIAGAPRAGHVATLLFALVAAVAISLTIALALSQRRAMRRLLLVARARRPNVAGAWGALDGEIIDGSIARTRTHSLDVRDVPASDGHTTTRTTLRFSDTFHADTLLIALDDGGTLRVHAKEAVFAADRTHARGDELLESVGPGDRARVVGRASGGQASWEVRSTGKDSLFVFGSRSLAPRAAAMRALALHALALAALLAITSLATLAAIASS